MASFKAVVKYAMAMLKQRQEIESNSAGQEGIMKSEMAALQDALGDVETKLDHHYRQRRVGKDAARDARLEDKIHLLQKSLGGGNAGMKPEALSALSSGKSGSASGETVSRILTSPQTTGMMPDKLQNVAHRLGDFLRAEAVGDAASDDVRML